MTPLLEVTNLSVGFPTGTARCEPVVDDVSFKIDEGEFLGIVGESGSGKSMTMAACTQLIPAPGRVLGGTILLAGQDIVGISDRRMQQLRGNVVSMVLQDAMTALHPTIPIERQMWNVLRAHRKVSRGEARRRCLDALEMGGIPRPEDRLGSYPHQLSGGQRQRVMIAMAIVNQPRLLIADEPTTALDVTLQAQIVDLLRRLNRELGLSIALVTHNFGVVARVTDRTLVMKDGRIVESGATADVLGSPEDAYTRRLISSVPRVDEPRESLDVATEDIAVQCQAVVCDLRATGGWRDKRKVRAVDHVDLAAYRGRTLGIVGESGAGKTTLARAMVRLTDVTQGRILLNGEDITTLAGESLRRRRRVVQMVFQDPYSSLSPRQTVRQIIAEPIGELGIELTVPLSERIGELLGMVELPEQLLGRYPVQLSGGQRQRVAIARALAAEPDILVADEPVSALDVTIQRQLVLLFARLQRELGLTLIVVAHDMGLVRAMCDQVAVLRDGRLVEYRNSEELFTDPHDPYTCRLLEAARSLGVPGLRPEDEPSASSGPPARIP